MKEETWFGGVVLGRQVVSRDIFLEKGERFRMDEDLRGGRVLWGRSGLGWAVWKSKERILVSDKLSGKAKGVFGFRMSCLEKQRAYSGFG